MSSVKSQSHSKAGLHSHPQFESRRSPYNPEPIEVAAKNGRPVSVCFKRKPVAVCGIVNVWRIDEEWWRTPISRLYFLLELESGARLTVFQDLEKGGWYRQ
jgi:hypothetical protein